MEFQIIHILLFAEFAMDLMNYSDLLFTIIKNCYFILAMERVAVQILFNLFSLLALTSGNLNTYF